MTSNYQSQSLLINMRNHLIDLINYTIRLWKGDMKKHAIRITTLHNKINNKNRSCIQMKTNNIFRIKVALIIQPYMILIYLTNNIILMHHF